METVSDHRRVSTWAASQSYLEGTVSVLLARFPARAGFEEGRGVSLGDDQLNGGQFALNHIQHVPLDNLGRQR